MIDVRWREAKEREVAARFGGSFTDGDGVEWVLVGYGDGRAQFENEDERGWAMGYEMALVKLGLKPLLGA